jgi:hypothetical protein
MSTSIDYAGAFPSGASLFLFNAGLADDIPITLLIKVGRRRPSGFDPSGLNGDIAASGIRVWNRRTGSMGTEDRREANRRRAGESFGLDAESWSERLGLKSRRPDMKAVLDALPAVDPKAAKERYEAMMADMRPRDSVERMCVESIVFYSLELERVELAQNARIRAQIENAPAEQARREQDEVSTLAKRLLTCERKPRKSKTRRNSLPEHPASIVLRLGMTTTGCRWLLDRWAELLAILNRNLPWRAPDKFKLVRLLGCDPLSLVDDEVVAQVFLACHVLNGDEGCPFQDIADALSGEERIFFERYFVDRIWDSVRPEDATAARNTLLLIVKRAIERLELPAEQARERDLLDAKTAPARLSVDYSPQGRRLQRYELKCEKAMFDAIDDWLKLRRAAARRKKDVHSAQKSAALKLLAKMRGEAVD